MKIFNTTLLADLTAQTRRGQAPFKEARRSQSPSSQKLNLYVSVVTKL